LGYFNRQTEEAFMAANQIRQTPQPSPLEINELRGWTEPWTDESLVFASGEANDVSLAT
jgi:hypothetical protein